MASYGIQYSVDQPAVRKQLEKILAHRLFVRSGRMGRFLRLAIERTLAGKAGDLKEYLIGVEVFDRRADYDPRVDPIVRVEARRLRSKLRAYYECDGGADPVVIEFIAGSYAPRIHFRGANGFAFRPAPSPVPVTLALLPFVNLSPSPANEYFSDGLTEELIHALTKLPGMRVAAWNSASQLRHRQEDIATIRRELSVATVLTGSLRLSGSSLRVRAQLIDTASGVYLWSETYDRQVGDVFEIQEEIAQSIVRTLSGRLAGGPETGIALRHRGTIQSYDYYLKGRHSLHNRRPDGLARSIAHFTAAVEADPESAIAYAGLADGYSLLVDHGLLHPAEGMPKAKAAASKALQLDPNLAEAYTSLAMVRSLYDHEWEEAEVLYQKAIALNPGYATAHQWLGCDLYAVLGRFAEARTEIEIARQLDPLSSIIRESCAFILMFERRYDEALQTCRELAEFDPSFHRTYTSMGRIYALQGRYPEALEMLEKGRGLAGNMPSILAAMAQVHALAGERKRAGQLRLELSELAKTRYVPLASFAIVHLGLGEHEKALEYLEAACEQRDLRANVLKAHPLYDPLRAYPRFQAILHRLKFPL